MIASLSQILCADCELRLYCSIFVYIMMSLFKMDYLFVSDNLRDKYVVLMLITLERC